MDHSADLFKGVGEAVYLAQVLELNLSVLISILADQFSVSLDAQLILHDDKRTLGQLIAALKKHGHLDDHGSLILGNALEKRNYITHEFFNRNAYALTDEESYQVAMDQLAADKHTIALATAIVLGFVQGFCKEFYIELLDILVRQGR